jgi:hypothetical protein
VSVRVIPYATTTKCCCCFLGILLCNISYMWSKFVCPSVRHDREEGSNGDSYSCDSYVVWKLDSSSFRKCKVFWHESPLTPLNFGVIGGWCEEIAVFFSKFSKVCCYKFWILNMNTIYSYAAQKSPQLLRRMYAVSWKLTKRHHFEVEHFDQVCSVKCIAYA